MLADLPRRAHAGLRPRLVPMRTGRPLKRWRYVGVYAPELMVCAGLVRVDRREIEITDPAKLEALARNILRE